MAGYFIGPLTTFFIANFCSLFYKNNFLPATIFTSFYVPSFFVHRYEEVIGMKGVKGMKDSFVWCIHGYEGFIGSVGFIGMKDSKDLKGSEVWGFIDIKDLKGSEVWGVHI